MDINLIINYLLESCMSLLYEGKVSNDKITSQLVFNVIVPFPVWAAIKQNN